MMCMVFSGGTDKSRDLVIDPVVAFSTYLGGNNYDYALGAAVDNSTGQPELIVDGETLANNFPTTAGVILPTWCPTVSNPAVMFLTKYAPGGSSLIYSTYVNAGNYECSANALAVDQSGDAYIAGTDISEAGGSPTSYGVVMKINSTANAIYYSVPISTVPAPNNYTNYVQGFTAIAVDSNGQAYTTGYSVSPVDNHSRYHYYSFAIKFSPTGGIDYETVLSTIYRNQDPMFGGRAIAVDSNGNAFVTGTGYDSTRNVGGTGLYELNPSGGIVQSQILTVTHADTYAPYDDAGFAIALDASDNIYITGLTNDDTVLSPANPNGFPVTTGALQPTFSGDSATSAYLIKLNSSFNVIYGSYLSTSGGNDATGNTWGNGIAVDSQGDVTIVGQTSNAYFWIVNPPSITPSQATYPTGNTTDGFITQFNGSNLSTLNYSTYWGGPESSTLNGLSRQAVTAVALDSSGDVYVTGFTDSFNFPVTSNALQPTNPDPSGYWAAYVSELQPSS